VSRPARVAGIASSLCALLAFGRGVCGAPPPSGEPWRLTLPEALERARAQSPTLAGLAARETAAAARLDAEEARRLPVLDAALGYERRAHVEEFVLRPAGVLSPPVTVFPDLPDRYRSHVGVTVPIYTGGRIDRGVEAAQDEIDAARGQSATGAADLDLDTTLAYWELVVARDRERVLAGALASYEAHLADSRNRAEVGIAAASEVLTVQVARDRASLARVRAAGEAEVAQADLARLLGAPGAVIEPGDALAAAVLPAEGIEALVQEALAARPERRTLLARAEAAGARAEQIRAALKPQLAAGAGYDVANPNPDVFPPASRWDGTWRVDVGARFLLWDGGATRSQAAAADAEAFAIRQELAELDRTVGMQVVRASTVAVTAAKALEVAELAVAAGEENVRVSRDRFREGLLPSSELLDAETGLLLAELERTEAVGATHRARASLLRAAGRPLP